jgi:hypothetical protein
MRAAERRRKGRREGGVPVLYIKVRKGRKEVVLFKLGRGFLSLYMLVFWGWMETWLLHFLRAYAFDFNAYIRMGDNSVLSDAAPNAAAVS